MLRRLESEKKTQLNLSSNPSLSLSPLSLSSPSSIVRGRIQDDSEMMIMVTGLTPFLTFLSSCFLPLPSLVLASYTCMEGRRDRKRRNSDHKPCHMHCCLFCLPLFSTTSLFTCLLLCLWISVICCDEMASACVSRLTSLSFLYTHTLHCMPFSARMHTCMPHSHLSSAASCTSFACHCRSYALSVLLLRHTLISSALLSLHIFFCTPHTYFLTHHTALNYFSFCLISPL